MTLHFITFPIRIRTFNKSMKNFIVVLTFLACVCVLALASSRSKRQRQHDLMGAYSPVPPMNAKTLQGSASGPFYFPQRQNHFDGSNANRWEQEYFVNDTFWKGPGSNAPVFLCVGGEGPGRRHRAQGGWLAQAGNLPARGAGYAFRRGKAHSGRERDGR